MTFYNTRLTDKVSQGFQGSPQWSTTEIANAAGFSAFNQDWSSAHWYFVADYTILNPRDQNEIRACFMAMRGRTHSFRNKDWGDYRATDEPLGTGDGTNTPRQLKKYYIFGAASFARNIILPIASTVVVTANGTPFAVTVNDETGMVAPASGNWPNGQVLLASFDFDVRVRFGQDKYTFTLPAKNVATVSIDLVEALTP